MTSTNDIRRSFLDYFGGAGHQIVPSAPLVPHNDPTLMFVNAGMVPFKNVFTGLETRPYTTAASSQKCVRAGGKHNDLDNVGYTARHHTFFEMLGNFSFGDYFKEQAIELAWRFITQDLGFAKDRLWVTVHPTDDEAAALWRKIAGIAEDRIVRHPDNMWAMGDTGPFGPNSEIFYDQGESLAGGPPGSPDEDGDRFLEFWNLVFMQFERLADGSTIDLPKPSVDTGMGMERAVALLQGVTSNYDIDLFRNLIEAGEELTGTKAEGERKASHRVIADHLRSTSFLVADGVLPANEGRGYVLRRIMRRAMRHAHLLGSREPLMHRLVPKLVAEMGAAYPELVRAQPVIEATLHQEETRFRQTLDKGLRLLDEATASMTEGDTLPGETAFKLYDTYGFPYDLTEDALRAQGLNVDRTGFDSAMAEQKSAARAAWKGSGAKASDDLWFDIAEEAGGTEFTGYTAEEGEGAVVAIVKQGQRANRATGGDEVMIVTNQTPFYAESGGQVGDTGEITGDNGLRAVVTDTSKQIGRLHVHHAALESGEVAVGDPVRLRIDTARRAGIRANHSATHLLHAALRERLGNHVAQKGSLVAPDRLRFDVSHPSAMGPAELAQVEDDVNAQVRANTPVATRLMTPEDAIAEGAMALFGEKYGDEVRVVSMGTDGGRYSVELCGGTHVSALGDIGLFKVVGESAVSSGIRRVEALTGDAARAYLNGRDEKLRATAAVLKSSPDEVPARVAALLEERRRLERELADAKRALAMGGGKAAEAQGPEQIGGHGFIGQVIEGLDPKSLRGLVDDAKKRVGSGVVALVAVNDGRATVAVGVTDDLTDGRNAVDLVRKAVAELAGQGGGGRPDMAQGGGPDASKAEAALEAVRSALREPPIAA